MKLTLQTSTFVANADAGEHFNGNVVLDAFFFVTFDKLTHLQISQRPCPLR